MHTVVKSSRGTAILHLHKISQFQCTFTYMISNNPKNKLSGSMYIYISQFSFFHKGRNFHHLYNKSLHHIELFCFCPSSLNTQPHQLFEHFQLSQLAGFKELVGKHLWSTLINSSFLFVGL